MTRSMTGRGQSCSAQSAPAGALVWLLLAAVSAWSALGQPVRLQNVTTGQQLLTAAASATHVVLKQHVNMSASIVVGASMQSLQGYCADAAAPPPVSSSVEAGVNDCFITHSQPGVLVIPEDIGPVWIARLYLNCVGAPNADGYAALVVQAGATAFFTGVTLQGDGSNAPYARLEGNASFDGCQFADCADAPAAAFLDASATAHFSKCTFSFVEAIDGRAAVFLVADKTSAVVVDSTFESVEPTGIMAWESGAPVASGLFLDADAQDAAQGGVTYKAATSAPAGVFPTASDRWLVQLKEDVSVDRSLNSRSLRPPPSVRSPPPPEGPFAPSPPPEAEIPDPPAGRSTIIGAAVAVIAVAVFAVCVWAYCSSKKTNAESNDGGHPPPGGFNSATDYFQQYESTGAVGGSGGHWTANSFTPPDQHTQQGWTKPPGPGSAPGYNQPMVAGVGGVMVSLGSGVAGAPASGLLPVSEARSHVLPVTSWPSEGQDPGSSYSRDPAVLDAAPGSRAPLAGCVAALELHDSSPAADPSQRASGARASLGHAVDPMALRAVADRLIALHSQTTAQPPRRQTGAGRSEDRVPLMAAAPLVSSCA